MYLTINTQSIFFFNLLIYLLIKRKSSILAVTFNFLMMMIWFKMISSFSMFR